MFVIMGGTGQVGSATARALLRRGEAVTVVTRDPARAADWPGVDIAVADAQDSEALRSAFADGRRALLLCPTADPTSDTDAEEHRTIDAILTAVSASALEKVVAVSTYGVRQGARIGDLGTLWALERGLARLSIPAAINRGAYYMTNWDLYLDAVRTSGVLPSTLPADLLLPMVSPADVGEAAAQRLVSPLDDVGVQYVEGPERYTPQDVADAFSVALGVPVTVDVAPAADLEHLFAQAGFSAAAAESYANMTRLTMTDMEKPENPWRGSVSLQEHVAAIT